MSDCSYDFKDNCKQENKVVSTNNILMELEQDYQDSFKK